MSNLDLVVEHSPVLLWFLPGLAPHLKSDKEISYIRENATSLTLSAPHMA